MVKIHEFPKIKKDGGEKEENMSVDYKKLVNLLNLLAGLLSQMDEDERQGNAYRRYRDDIQYYGDGEIIKKINTEDEDGVKTNPLYYSALIDVAREKGLIPAGEN